MSRYTLIAAYTESWPVQSFYQLLAMSPASYYQWRQQPACAPVSWHIAAQAAFTRHAHRYGTQRSRAALRPFAPTSKPPSASADPVIPRTTRPRPAGARSNRVAAP
ncbi:hypothetical protein [Hymenobacter sp. BT188]|uniref:hypothetical protein n=1 Tax=Hymenobacter sp. BT188 TaxID=2763504 RepID=UPI0016517E8B|nr:hypothetical protein [Hymenobacter sp. BT188]